MKITHIVKEDRRRVTKRIQSIDDAAMTRNEAAEILHSEVTLDGAHDRAAEKRGESSEYGAPRRFNRRKGREESDREADQSGASHAADESLPCLVGADRRQQRPAPDGLAPEVLQHVAHLHHEDQEKQHAAAVDARSIVRREDE